jgi:hypothetical protein
MVNLAENTKAAIIYLILHMHACSVLQKGQSEPQYLHPTIEQGWILALLVSS